MLIIYLTGVSLKLKHTQMKNEKKTITIPKRDYISPAVEVTLVEMEGGIATSSAVVQPGGDTGTPVVKGWEEDDKSQTWEL